MIHVIPFFCPRNTKTSPFVTGLHAFPKNGMQSAQLRTELLNAGVKETINNISRN